MKSNQLKEWEEFDETFPEISWDFNSKNKDKSVRGFISDNFTANNFIKEKVEGLRKWHKVFECGTNSYESFCENQSCPRATEKYFNEALEALLVELRLNDKEK